MGDITLSQIGAALGLLAALIASCSAIFVALRKAIRAMFAIQMKDIKLEMEANRKAINQVDMENSKNFLVSFLSRIDRGEPADEIELQRFWEQYEHYHDMGGNSYIQNKVAKLQAIKKL